MATLDSANSSNWAPNLGWVTLSNSGDSTIKIEIAGMCIDRNNMPTLSYYVCHNSAIYSSGTITNINFDSIGPTFTADIDNVLIQDLQQYHGTDYYIYVGFEGEYLTITTNGVTVPSA
jgi:hypothetical protein